MNRFRDFARKVSRNHTRTVWVLKCDIRKFFANIDHAILKEILRKRVMEDATINLVGAVVDSFHTKGKPRVGLPLGNLTSQLLVNIYMNEFDHFIKRELRVSYYIRYADDFVFLHEDRSYLEQLIPKISAYLEKRLRLELHPNKVFLTTFASGVDFLGWVHFPHYRILRTATKRRMFRNLDRAPKENSIASYKGLLGHGNTYKLQEILSARYPDLKQNAGD